MALPPQAVAALQRGDTIEAIKLTREATGLGLKQAKEAVERHAHALAEPPPGFTRAPAIVSASGGALPHDASLALQRGQVVEAVRLTREATGLGLKEAKQLVDAARGAVPDDGAVPGLASEGALFDPTHEPGRVRRGAPVRWVWAVLVAAVVAACFGWLR